MIGEGCLIGPNVVVGPGCVIEDGTLGSSSFSNKAQGTHLLLMQVCVSVAQRFFET